MKLEIKENMYCRTCGGAIKKIVSLEDFNEREYKLNGFYIDKDAIKKTSYNIIDLIEVGDYINGEKIDYISISKDGKKRLLIRDNIYFFDKYISIKSIITKEQFESMSYKVM